MEQGKLGKNGEKESMKSIEEQGKTLDRAVFAGVCAKMKWHPGKIVSEKQFQASVKAFLESPINGKGKTIIEEKAKEEASE